MENKTKIVIALLQLAALAWFGLSRNAQGVIPPPDGGYPGFNTAEGQNALFSLTTGVANAAVGWHSLFSNTSGGFNTAVGAGTLVLNTGDENTAVGAAALLFNTDGVANTANGAFALLNNTTGHFNNAVGENALMSNQTGEENNALGAWSLRENIDGSFNTAIGDDALTSNVSGNNNTAVGDEALATNILGEANTATGAFALSNNTEGGGNSAFGYFALSHNTSGLQNTAVGSGALALSTGGMRNTALGWSACHQVVTASNVTCIGANVGGADESSTTWIGNVYGVTTVSGATLPVLISSDGQLGTASSSRRFKEEIQPMDNVSESILALRPVTFQYKSDQSNTPQFGLIAEEVAEVNPDLVVRDKDRQMYTVRYDAVNAMLLNEFLKEHQTVQELKKQVAELTAGLQKVSAQLQVSKGAPRTVLNDR